MIHYIFSDKTGTLTQNIMEFKRISIGPFKYGLKEPAQKEYEPGVTNVNFEDKKFFDHLNDKNHSNYGNIHRYIECLGLCHTVITETRFTKGG